MRQIPARVRVTALVLMFAGLMGSGATGLIASEYSVLVFSKTLLYRHASITNGIAAIKSLGEKHHFQVTATEDSSWFTEENLQQYRAVIFLSTSGEVLNPEQKRALREFVKKGGGLAGVHAAVAGDLATEGNWPWYEEALCASFTNHSQVVQATVRVEDKANASTASLPEQWVRTDEWYNFKTSPRPRCHVLASVDESSYTGGTMGADHPISWCHNMGQGRIWYTALGHTEASFSEPLFLDHLLGGIEVAAGVKPAVFVP